MTLVGCGLVSPVETDDPVEPLPTIEIGSDGSPASELIAALQVAALQAGNEPAVGAGVAPGTEILALADNSPMAMPLFAGTQLEELSDDPLPMDAASTIADLATAVAPDVSLLKNSKLDGGLVWATTPETGLTSLTELADLPAGAAVVAPGFAMRSAVPTLRAAYGADPEVEEMDDPSERVAALTGGDAVVALFRRTESVELDGLVQLEDPVGVLTPDPLVVAVSAEFADQRPDAVLVLDAVHAALHQEAWAELVAAASADGLEPAIAGWLQTRRLA